MFGMNPTTGQVVTVGVERKKAPPATPITDKVSPRFGEGTPVLKRGRVVELDPDLADEQVRTNN